MIPGASVRINKCYASARTPSEALLRLAAQASGPARGPDASHHEGHCQCPAAGGQATDASDADRDRDRAVKARPR
jgi:hypothetical protein